MRADRTSRLALTELCLAALTVSVAYGFGRVFSDGGWFFPLVAVVVLAHGSGAVLRQLNLGVSLQVMVVAIGTMLVMAWSQASDTLRFFLPTADTLRAFGSAFDEALALYPEARAPTEPVAGFVLAAMVGIAIVATMSDIAAFRLEAEIQALVPPLTLFLFCSVLGSGEGRLVAATTFAILASVFVLLMRTLSHRSTTTWLPGDDDRGPIALVKVGGSLSVLAAIAALVVGPALPGAGDQGMWSWRGGAGTGDRVIVSPLVDIRSRLVNQSSEVAFTVESEVPSYWRMMALDDFDGERFGLRTNFRTVTGRLGTTPSPQRTLIEQRVQIDALASPYLPAAFEPTRVEAGSEPVRWDDRSSTLLLERDQAPRDFEYVVESALPDFDPERLRAAPDQVSPSIAERYLTLPELDPRVIELAESIVEDAEAQYDKALALQDYLRGNFEYSLDVSPGHSGSELARFLFDTRAGYCEQFSVSFAALARVVGLPSRVAVGFTVGEQSRTNRDLYTVRGEHAHAWPEVFLQGIGWVPFEPTPGRGDPRSERHTGVPADQVGGASGTATTTTTEATTTPTAPGDLDEFPDIFDIPEGGGAGPLDLGDDGPPTALLVAGAILAVIGAWLLLVATAVGARRSWRRRRTRARPGARVLVAWDEMVEAARSLRLRPRPAETHREFTTRVVDAIDVDPTTVFALADAAAMARYGPDDLVLDDQVGDAIESARSTVAAVRAARSLRQRVVDRIDLRRAIGPRRGFTIRRLATLARS